MYETKEIIYFIFKEEKREVPSMLRKLLAVDAYLTHAFVSWAEQFLFARVLNLNCKLFEVKLIIYMLILY